MIFLDSASGTKPYPEVILTITDVLANHWGNSGADYSFGHDARNIIDNVTAMVAADINCKPENIIWTSGACEANSLALSTAHSPCGFIISELEHASINHIRGWAFTFGHHNYLVGNSGRLGGFVDLQELEVCLASVKEANITPLVSIAFANSEIGVIQNIRQIAKLVHEYGGILHTDATQLYPWQTIDVEDLGIDMMSVSGQKLHAVKGIGFLYVRDGIAIKPLIFGSQQDGHRGGTLPTHLIAAFGKALELTRTRNSTPHVEFMRNKLMAKLLTIPGVTLNGPKASRLPNNISITIDGVDADQFVAMCDEYEIMVAKGSACQAYNPVPSSALLAIGLTEKEALSTIRISLDEFNTVEEIDYVGKMMEYIITTLRKLNS